MLNYLLSPEFQIVNTAGKPCTGYLEVYYHGTRDRYYCASDFNGTLYPFQVPLDSLGGNVVLADDSHAYDVYVYNRYGSILMSRYNVHPSSGGSSGGVITSSDGSITVTPTQDGYDLSVTDGKASTLRAAADSLYADGSFYFRRIEGQGDAIYIDNGCIKFDDGWYHFSATVKLNWTGAPINQTGQVKLWCGHTYDIIDFDYSYNHEDTIVLDGDIWIGPHSTHYVSFHRNFGLSVAYMRSGLVAELIDCDLHSIIGQGTASGGGGTDYQAGDGIIISGETISVDPNTVQGKLTEGPNITISNENVISTEKTVVAAGTNVTVTSSLDNVTRTRTYTVSSSGGGSQQVQSNWAETDTSSVSYIQNKPQNLVQDASYVHTDNNFTTTLKDKLDGIESGAEANVQSDWNETNTSSDAYILNKPTIPVIPPFKELVAGSGITITEGTDTVTIASNGGSGGGSSGMMAIWSGDNPSNGVTVSTSTSLSTVVNTLTNMQDIYNSPFTSGELLGVLKGNTSMREGYMYRIMLTSGAIVQGQSGNGYVSLTVKNGTTTISNSSCTVSSTGSNVTIVLDVYIPTGVYNAKLSMTSYNIASGTWWPVVSITAM